jgi:hypothetical protein
MTTRETLLFLAAHVWVGSDVAPADLEDDELLRRLLQRSAALRELEQPTCSHAPRCRHEDPAIAAAICRLSAAKAAASVSVVLALVADGPAGIGVDGVQRCVATHHRDVVGACNNAVKAAAIQLLLFSEGR